MVYENCTIYGPYRLADNRDRVTITSPNGVVKFVSYAKYLMEVHLDRFLDPDLETVDHIDNDFNNNNLNNLRILSRKEHCSLEVARIKDQTFVCGMCNTPFTLSGKKLNDAFQNRLRGFSGPYCSRSCAGKASHLKSNDPRAKFQDVKREKYTLKNPDVIFDVSSSGEYLKYC